MHKERADGEQQLKQTSRVRFAAATGNVSKQQQQQHGGKLILDHLHNYLINQCSVVDH